MAEAVAGIVSSALSTAQGLIGDVSPLLGLFVGLSVFGLVVSIVVGLRR